MLQIKNDNLPAMINTFMGLNPTFSIPVFVSGYHSFKNNQYNDALYNFKKSVNIDNGLREGYFSIYLYNKLFKTEYCNDYKTMITYTYNWMLEADNSCKYKNLMRDFFDFSSKHYNDPDFIRQTVDFIELYINKEKEKCVKSYLYSIKGHFFLLNYYFSYNLGYLDKALECYIKSIDISENRTRASTWRGLAEQAYLSGDIDKAIDHAKASLKYNNKYQYGYTTLGILLLNSGNINGYKYVKMGVEKKIEKYAIKEVNENTRKFILSKLIENSNNSLYESYKKYELSCYYFGYCPEHIGLKTYIILRDNKRIIISHIDKSGNRFQHS